MPFFLNTKGPSLQRFFFQLTISHFWVGAEINDQFVSRCIVPDIYDINMPKYILEIRYIDPYDDKPKTKYLTFIKNIEELENPIFNNSYLIYNENYYKNIDYEFIIDNLY